MRIFEYIKNILFLKKKYVQGNREEIKQYNIHMINRWLSMSDPECANLINETTNKINYLDGDREMHYKLLLNITPQQEFKKINYIKKE